MKPFPPKRSKQIRVLIVATVAAALVGTLAYLYIVQGITWEETKESVRTAPAWIFLLTLIFLPPLGLPLSIFLFAVGARFDILTGSIIACSAIVAHHLITIGLSKIAADFINFGAKGSRIWNALEVKTNGNNNMLLFLWGLSPGLPYVAKLYVPLAMGADYKTYLKWNSAGHAIGAILFVSFGNAIFDGLGATVIVLIALGIALSIAAKLFYNRLKETEAAPSPEKRASQVS